MTDFHDSLDAAIERGHSAEKDAPIADGERIWIAGEPVWVRYDPDLVINSTPRWGAQSTEPTGLNSVEVKPYGAQVEAIQVPGMRKVIILRRWDERVFLHEVLHILLGKQYPAGQLGYSEWIEDPKHEKAVREIEDGLWDMGWRLFDGVSHVDPTNGPRLPAGSDAPTDSGHRVGDPCEAIVAQFIYGPQTCMATSVAVVTDPTWGTTHVACAEHAGRPTSPDLTTPNAT